jgi:CRP-like cAMP-binding protein
MDKPDIDVLARIPFFSKLPKHYLVAILAITEVRHIDSGSNLFSERDEADGLYVILSGNFQIYILSGLKGGPPKVLATIEKGQYVGEFGLIDGNPRSASVKALTGGDVLFLPSQGFAFLLETEPSIAICIIDYLCEVIMNAPKLKINSPKVELIKTKNLKPNLHNMKSLSAIMREHNRMLSLK